MHWALHFEEDGVTPADISLVEGVLQLLKALNLASYDKEAYVKHTDQENQIRKRGATEFTFFNSLRTILLSIKTSPGASSQLMSTLGWVSNERCNTSRASAWRKKKIEALNRLKQTEQRRSRSLPPRRTHTGAARLRTSRRNASPSEAPEFRKTEIILKPRTPEDDFQPRSRSSAILKLSADDSEKSESSIWERAKQRLPFSRFGKE